MSEKSVLKTGWSYVAFMRMQVAVGLGRVNMRLRKKGFMIREWVGVCRWFFCVSLLVASSSLFAAVQSGTYVSNEVAPIRLDPPKAKGFQQDGEFVGGPGGATIPLFIAWGKHSSLWILTDNQWKKLGDVYQHEDGKGFDLENAFGISVAYSWSFPPWVGQILGKVKL